MEGRKEEPRKRSAAEEKIRADVAALGADPDRFTLGPTGTLMLKSQPGDEN